MLFFELIFLLAKEDNTDYPVIFCCISHVKLHQQVALTALYRQVNALVRVPIVTGSEGKGQSWRSLVRTTYCFGREKATVVELW